MVLVDSLGGGSKKINISPIPQKKHPFVQFILNLILILFFSSFVFLLINLPAYYSIYKYKFAPQSVEIASPEKLLASAKEPGAIKQYDDNTIVIPKIGVKAPITWDVGGGQVMDTLQKGVVHLGGTSRPGEKGNTFLTGHSSNYWWKGGDYNNVFALLPELSKGDEIFAIYHGQLKKYKVTDKLEVKKSEVKSYVESDDERITLMTCVPVGTNLKRLLILADPES